HNALFRGWKKHVKLLDLRVQTKLFEFPKNPFRVLLVVRRPNMVRMRREQFHIRAHVLWIRKRAQLLFPLAFRLRRFGGVAVQRLLFGNNVIPGGRERKRSKNNRSKHSATKHISPLSERPYSA